jgi:hypothetical protein
LDFQRHATTQPQTVNSVVPWSLSLLGLKRPEHDCKLYGAIVIVLLVLRYHGAQNDFHDLEVQLWMAREKVILWALVFANRLNVVGNVAFRAFA